MQEKTIFSAVSHFTEELRKAVKARGRHVGKHTNLEQLLEECEEDPALLAGVRTRLSGIFTEFQRDLTEPISLVTVDDIHAACRILDQFKHDHRRDVDLIDRCEHLPMQQQLEQCHY